MYDISWTRVVLVTGSRVYDVMVVALVTGKDATLPGVYDISWTPTITRPLYLDHTGVYDMSWVSSW